MKTLNLRTMAPRFALLGLAMLAAAGLAIAITPTSKIADEDKLVKKCGFAGYNCQG